MPSPSNSHMNAGFVKLWRGPLTYELMRDPKLWTLFSLIALRARRIGGLNLDGLVEGEALIGDHQSIGLSQQEYRSRLARLVKLGVVTTKPTSRGTVAKLVNTEVFDISSAVDQRAGQPAPNEQATIGQRTANDRPTTNKKGKREKNEKNEKKEEEDAPLPAALDTPDFRKAWNGYLDYRNEKRLATLTERSQEAKLKELAAWGSERAIRAIERSIANGWQGIFEDRHSQTQRAPPPAMLPPPPNYKNGNHEF